MALSLFASLYIRPGPEKKANLLVWPICWSNGKSNEGFDEGVMCNMTQRAHEDLL